MGCGQISAILEGGIRIEWVGGLFRYGGVYAGVRTRTDEVMQGSGCRRLRLRGKKWRGKTRVE